VILYRRDTVANYSTIEVGSNLGRFQPKVMEKLNEDCCVIETIIAQFVASEVAVNYR
jgi:hypothetical protein